MLSIITPVLNGRKYIQYTIESIQELNIPYEHIIVDGGSTDGTIEFASQYQHIKLLHQKDKTGMYGAIHEGFLVSKGEYITWVNADDYIIKNGYELMYKHIKDREIDLVYSNAIYHYNESYKYKKMYARHFGRYLLKEGIMPFVQPSSMYSRLAYDKVGGLDFNRFKIIGDRDFFQRMAYNTEFKFGYISTFSIIFLKHSNSLFFKNQKLKLKEYSYCVKSNVSLSSRIIFHLSGIIRSLVDILKINRV